MKQQHRLNRWQWLGAFTWPVMVAPIFFRDDSPLFISLRFIFAFTLGIGFAILRWQYQSPIPSSLFSLTLIVEITDTKEDRELFEKLHHLFKSNFPNDKYVEYDGCLRNKVQIRFNFKGADADVIMESLQPLLKDTSFPPDSHFLALVGPYKTREFPIFTQACPSPTSICG